MPFFFQIQFLEQVLKKHEAEVLNLEEDKVRMAKVSSTTRLFHITFVNTSLNSIDITLQKSVHFIGLYQLITILISRSIAKF